MSKLKSKLNDIFAGFVVAIVSLPVAIGVGLIAFAPLGMEYTKMGILAGLIASIFSSIVPVFFRASHLQNIGPGPVSAGIIAALISSLLADKELIQLFSGNPDQLIPIICSLVFLAIFFGGVFQLLIGLFRLGEFVKVIPHTVIAGLMNGIAVLIFLNQIPKFFGFAADSGIIDVVTGNKSFNPSDAMVGFLVLFLCWGAGKWRKNSPRTLIGVLGGTLFYYIIKFLNFGELGGTIGSIPRTIPFPTQISDFILLIQHPSFSIFFMKIIGFSLTLGALSGLNTLIAASTADALTNTRSSSIRELTSLGAANMISGLFAGLPCGGIPSRVMINYHAGGRGYGSHISSALVSLAIVCGLGFAVGVIPHSVVAGVLIFISFNMIDGWTKQLISKVFSISDKELLAKIIINLALIALVGALVILSGIKLAVIIGLISAFFIFLLESGKQIIRRKYFGDKVHSRTVRDPRCMDVLTEKAGSILIIELQGPLFFGTADKVLTETDKHIENFEICILDFKRVNDIDSSGVLILKRIDNKCLLLGKKLFLANLLKKSDKRIIIEEMGLDLPEKEGRVFPDLDRALEAAENIILEKTDSSLVFIKEIPLEKAIAFQNLLSEELEIIEKHMVRKNFDQGELIMKEGDQADGFYILTSGSVSIVKKIKNEDRFVKLVNFGVGVSIGEMAILTGKPRSADILAVTEVTCYFMSATEFENIRKKHPEIAVKVLFNLGASMARHLEKASNTIRELET